MCAAAATAAAQLDYDLALLDLPGSFISEQQPAALAGLTSLQVFLYAIARMLQPLQMRCEAAQPARLAGACVFRAHNMRLLRW